MDRDAPEERAKGDAVRVPPKERLEFKRLLAASPTYFGNLEKNPFKPTGVTTRGHHPNFNHGCA